MPKKERKKEQTFFKPPVEKLGNPIGPILFPSRYGLIRSSKPGGIIVSDDSKPDSATSVEPLITLYKGFGFQMLNKKIELKFNTPLDKINDYLKPHQVNEITIFSNTHGNPGLHFAAQSDPHKEISGIIQFAQLVREIELYTHIRVPNIVLGGCFSGTELYNPKTGFYTSSSARLLSILLPDKNVVGFIGEYAGSKISHVYKKMDQKSDEHDTGEFLAPDKAAVLFLNGTLMHSPEGPLYCSYQYTANYIIESLQLEEDEKDSEGNFKFYQPFFKELAEKDLPLETDPLKNLGLWQLNQIEKVKRTQQQQKHAALSYPSPSPSSSSSST